MPDGRVVVANGGSNELRVYSNEGVHIKTVGERGSGPGEFTSLLGLFALPGDSLLAYDPGLARVSVFTPEVEFARVVETTDPNAWRPRVYGVLPNGSMVTTDAIEPYSHMSLPSGFLRHATRWVLRNMEFVGIDTLGVFLGDESLNVRGPNFAAYLSAPFLRRTHAALGDQEVIVGEAQQYELRRISLNGLSTRLIRKRRIPQNLTDSVVNAVRQSDDPDLRPLLQELDFPEHYPAYAAVLMDSQGYVWVKEFPLSPQAATDEWTIFSKDGEWLSTVMTPRTEVVQIGSDFLVGLARDDLGVEFVRVYRLNR
jgi:hypothetical protein